MGIKKEAFTGSVRADDSKDLATSIITNPVRQINDLHAKTEGYIRMLRKNKNQEKEREWHYKLHQVEANISEWVTYNSFFSMNTFYTPKGQITNLKEIRTAFVDIDCYNEGFTAEQVEARLEADYYGVEIPTPNMVIHSGRGLNLIWFLEPISGLAIDRWDRLQRAIFEKLKDLGADKKALDAARVFRLAGSVNSKCEEVVYYNKYHEYRYSLEEIAEEFFPDILKQVKRPKQNRKPNRQPDKPRPSSTRYIFNEYTLMIARMDDLYTLVRLRNGDVEGSREYMLFLYRYWALVQHQDKEIAKELMLKLNSAFNRPLRVSEAIQDTKSAERYYDSSEPFRITHERVIEWLDVTPEEQKHLKTIISKTESKRRNTDYQRQKRRANGVRERSTYEAVRSSEKSDRAAQLAELISKDPTATQQQLAVSLGVSQQTISRLLKLI